MTTEIPEIQTATEILKAIIKKIKSNPTRIPTSTPIYECQKCKDRGGFIRKNQNGYEYWVTCQCQIQKDIERYIAQSNLPENCKGKSFENYNTQSEQQKKAKQLCQTYADNPQGNLLLCGQIGSGKTHLAIATLLAIAKKHKRIKYQNYKDMVKGIANAARQDDTYYTELDKYRLPSVLLIDDFFKGNEHKETHLSYAYEIIDHRYKNSLMTIITTEKNISEMVRIEEAITSRLLEKSTAVLMDGIKNYRLRV